MITTSDVHNFLQKLAAKPAPVKDEPAPEPPPPPPRRPIQFDPNKGAPPVVEPPIKGNKKGPTGGCTINGNYYNPCPSNPNKPGL